MKFIPGETLHYRNTHIEITYIGIIKLDEKVIYFGSNKDKIMIFEPEDYLPLTSMFFDFTNDKGKIIEVYDNYKEIEDAFAAQYILLFSIEKGYRKFYSVQNSSFEDFLKDFEFRKEQSRLGLHVMPYPLYFLPINKKNAEDCLIVCNPYEL